MRFDRPKIRRLGRGSPRGEKVAVIPPKDPLDEDPRPTSFRIGKKLLQEIDAIAKELGYKRTEAVVLLLKWAVKQHRSERKTSKDTQD
jgi:hypothetical protein